MYRDAGYSFVSITDHNRVTQCNDLNDDQFLAIPGTEDTVSHLLPLLGPHMARLFVDEPLRTGTPQDRIDRACAEGAVVSLCHPSWNGNLWTGEWSEAAIVLLRGFQLIEVWNPHSNSSEDVRRWDAALRTRRFTAPLWGIAVDDCHRREQFNRGWVMVKVPEITSPALRRALVGGAFYASTGPAADFSGTGQSISVRLDGRGQIRFLDARGTVRAEVDGDEASYAAVGDEQFVRVEVRSKSGAAWSQPFWLDASSS
jgi:hypothetical protein